MDIIEKIVHLENDELINKVNEILKDQQNPPVSRKPGWGKGMINGISEDFDDFVPSGFS
ncbi:hypothetical protein [Dyadobacter sediminis]|uniref:hypothetical protein n=1 Tax=Dyadobacter sediminis TaxID=1493691 RepID=UPI001485DE73|nr:hypothetical protein [Dyadobacter sediminis]